MKQPMAINPPTFAEFFAGVGLVRQALEPHGWRCVFSNDIDPAKASLYTTNYGPGEFTLGDICDIRAGDIPRDTTLATACFPCIDLSLAGNRAGLDGSKSGVFWHFVNILRSRNRLASPIPLLLIENVVGFLSSREGRDLKAAVASLNRVGYSCDALVVDARHFTPQSRPRLFIIGEHESSRFGILRRLEAVDTLPSHVRPKRLSSFMATNQDLRWGRVDFKPLPHKDRRLSDILEHIPPESPLWWTKEREDKLLHSMRPLHRARVKALLRVTGGAVATVYRRTRSGQSVAEVRTDGLAGCLRTPRGGSSKQFLLHAKRGRLAVRNLTPRECARLQGVPDGYDIGADMNKALLAFGDGVCVPVVEWIATQAFPLAPTCAPALPSYA